MSKALKKIVCATLALGTLVSAATMFSGCTTNRPEAELKLEFNGKTYTLEYTMYRKIAPATVNHFIKLVEEGYYNGLCVHNYEENKMYTGAYYYDETKTDLLDYKPYFETVATVKEKTDCDVVGHFDLVSKFNERFPRFDESAPRYLHPALEALDALLDAGAVFEVNTGAIARGYRRAAYPAPLFLHRIAERRGNVTLSSDAHDKENLLFAFPEACKILRASGITTALVRDKNGWREIGV